MHFLPGGDVLKVPSKVDVYVKNTLKPTRVELWTGPTGTQLQSLIGVLIQLNKVFRWARVRDLHSQSQAANRCLTDLSHGSTLQVESTLTLFMQGISSAAANEQAGIPQSLNRLSPKQTHPLMHRLQVRRHKIRVSARDRLGPVSG